MADFYLHLNSFVDLLCDLNASAVFYTHHFDVSNSASDMLQIERETKDLHIAHTSISMKVIGGQEIHSHRAQNLSRYTTY